MPKATALIAILCAFTISCLSGSTPELFAATDCCGSEATAKIAAAALAQVQATRPTSVLLARNRRQPAAAPPETPSTTGVSPTSSGCPAPPSAFGSKDKLAVGVEGKIYFLDTTVRKFPDFTTMKSEGSIYSAKWDVPQRAFTEGFPGVTNRFEWFAIDYQGPIYVPKSGIHGFRMASDDGSMLYIDGNVVINLDGLHAWAGRAGKVDLAEGEHQFRLSYMQGPRASLGLQLWVMPPGEKEKIFNLQDFSKDVIASRSQLAATEDAKGIRINLGAEVLFDSGKFVLRPAAAESLQQLATLLQSYPGLPILIEGHTDSVGKPDANQVLSEHRANAVKEWLASNGKVPSGCMMTRGYGKTMPIASNETGEDRQKNRRVEIKILKITAAIIGGKSQ